MKKFTRQIISAVLSLSVGFVFAPMTPAADDVPSIHIPLTEPSPERILCVVNDFESSQDTIIGYLETEPYRDFAALSAGDKARLSDIVNEDGTLTELGVSEFSYIGANASTVREFFDLCVEEMYRDIVLYIGEGFSEDYPDAAALGDLIIERYLDGNENPHLYDVMKVITGTDIYEDDDGYMYIMMSDPVYISFEEYGSVYTTVSDLIAPTGAYNKPSADFGSYRNVFLQLKDAWEAGEIDPTEAFTILTGYTTDHKGDLKTVAPIYSYFRDENGKIVRDLENFDCINDDGTVADTGLTPRDFAVASASAYFDFLYRPFEGTIQGLIVELTTKYSNDSTDYLDREWIAESVDADIASAKEAGLTDEEIATALIYYYGNTDAFNTPVAGFETGYAADADGNKINISQIMDANGKFLTDAYGCADVQTLMEEFLSDMSLEAILKGDASNDGKINLSDAALILKQIAKWDVTISDESADVNADNKVNLSDVSTILKHIAGWDVEFVY